ncbi:hypothetical protein [Hymenobacter sediminicola]|uniref:Uncharacterized protein n=1 Tax=Hymenobacter sediminicola TaxID=2761579 RepID=A0A7G7W312_9BACT|nr:hypothetical protein [Hymenobacter sediminicola]QNH60755.1 hypothetical protein H4317_11190 [Hymenobacter sediminicola]
MLEQNAPRFRYTFDGEFGRRVLRADPKGWEETGVNLHRDPKYHGQTLEYITQLAFVQDGRVYLSQAYAQRGVEADVRLLIEQYDPNAFVWKFYSEGQVHMLSRVETATEFRCNIVQKDFTQKFNNRTDTAVDAFGNDSIGGVALPAKQPLVLELHSQAIFKRYQADYAPDPPMIASGFVMDDPSREQLLYFGFGQPQVDDFEVEEVYGGPVVGERPQAVPIYRTKEEGDFTIDFEFFTQLRVKLTASSGSGDFDTVEGEYYFRINDEPAVLLASFGDTSIAGDFFATVDVPRRRITRRLRVGDRIYLFGRIYVHDINPNALGQYRFEIQLQHNGGHFRMEALTQTPATSCQGLLAYEAMERVCQAATDERVAFRSAYFGRTDTQPAYPGDGAGSGLFISGGFQVRGFPLSEKPMTLTWEGLFDSLAATHWLGTGVEQRPEGPVVVVEPVPYFYPDTLTLDLSSAPVEVTSTTEADEFYNKVELGYRKWETQQVNGLQEPNSRREWALPLTAAKNTYTFLSPYSAAGFYLEATRRQRYDATATTDQGSDADSFLICVLRSPSGWQTERDQRFSRVEGVLSPDTLYNLRLTPARLLRRHGPALRACLLHQDRERIRFSFGEGNNELLTQLMGEAAPVAESADVVVESLPAPLWRPEQDEFTAPVSREQLAQLLAAPRGRIRYRDQTGLIKEGWILDFKHTAREGEGTFTLRPALTLLAV